MKTIASLFLAFLLPVVAGAADKPEYLNSFDPAKGFKPAQRDLTEVYLQLAGSLENYGNPEPYLQHIAAEHARIEKLYREKTGKPARSFRPDYMTDEYIEKLCANWKFLAPKLGLEIYAKQFGHTMRNAIKGTRETGTTVIDIFNGHQATVYASLTGKTVKGADFESLRAELTTRLELTHKIIDYHDYEIAQRDAISFSRDIQGITDKLFARIDKGMAPDAAASLKEYLMSVIMDTGMMAESELKIGIEESALSPGSTAGR